MRIAQKLSKSLGTYRPFLHGKYWEYGLVLFVLTLITLVLTDWALFRHETLFTGGIGDATSGFTYLYYADQDWNPFWAHTNLINYPYGENLASPVYITWFLVMTPLWVLSHLTSPIMAMNLMTVIGYVSSGIAAYWLIKRLSGKWFIAAFAAYGVAFAPYHIMKSTDHLTNVFNWVVVAVIAAFLALWRRQTWQRIVLLALAISAAVYTDGYYIFIVGVLLLALIISFVAVDIYTLRSLRPIWGKLKAVVYAGLLTAVFASPVLIVQATAAQDISNNLANSRSDVRADAQYYGSRPIDFVLPPVENPLFKDQSWYKAALESKKDRSITESASYLGWVPLVLIAVGTVVVVGLLRKRKQQKSYTASQHLMITSIVAAPFVIIWMLPPTAHAFGHTIYFPMAYLLEITTYWRVPGRIILALQPLVIIAAALALNELIGRRRLPARKAMWLSIGLIVLLALEYLALINRPAFSTSMMPSTYSWLRQQSDIKAIAELPLVDRPIEVGGYYSFAQMIHDKPLVNTSLAKTKSGLMNPLGYDDNPETINFIASRGVDTVIIHGRPCESKSWGALIHTEQDALMPPFMKEKRGEVCVYRLNHYSVPDNLYAYTQSGFADVDYIDTQEHFWQTFKENHATLRISDQKGAFINEKRSVVLSGELAFIGDFQPKMLEWRLSQEGKTIATGKEFGHSLIRATVDASKTIELSMVVDEKQLTPAPGELGLRQLQVTAVQ